MIKFLDILLAQFTNKTESTAPVSTKSITNTIPPKRGSYSKRGASSVDKRAIAAKKRALFIQKLISRTKRKIKETNGPMPETDSTKIMINLKKFINPTKKYFKITKISLIIYKTRLKIVQQELKKSAYNIKNNKITSTVKYMLIKIKRLLLKGKKLASRLQNRDYKGYNVYLKQLLKRVNLPLSSSISVPKLTRQRTLKYKPKKLGYKNKRAIKYLKRRALRLKLKQRARRKIKLERKLRKLKRRLLSIKSKLKLGAKSKLKNLKLNFKDYLRKHHGKKRAAISAMQNDKKYFSAQAFKYAGQYLRKLKPKTKVQIALIKVKRELYARYRNKIKRRIKRNIKIRQFYIYKEAKKIRKLSLKWLKRKFRSRLKRKRLRIRKFKFNKSRKIRWYIPATVKEAKITKPRESFYETYMLKPILSRIAKKKREALKSGKPLHLSRYQKRAEKRYRELLKNQKKTELVTNEHIDLINSLLPPKSQETQAKSENHFEDDYEQQENRKLELLDNLKKNRLGIIRKFLGLTKGHSNVAHIKQHSNIFVILAKKVK